MVDKAGNDIQAPVVEEAGRHVGNVIYKAFSDLYVIMNYLKYKYIYI